MSVSRDPRRVAQDLRQAAELLVGYARELETSLVNHEPPRKPHRPRKQPPLEHVVTVLNLHRHERLGVHRIAERLPAGYGWRYVQNILLEHDPEYARKHGRTKSQGR